MRYVVVAFAGEGRTDERFLAPVIRRLLQELLVGEASATIQHLTITPADRSIQTLRDVLLQRRREFDLLILHTDGGGDPTAARRERVDPLREALAAQNDAPAVAAAVPVHETEAWALADGDALRDAFGVTGDDRTIGLPPLAEIERLPDPKGRLQSIYQSVRGRRRPRSPVPLERIGELVALDRLRRLAAFQDLKAELCRALRDLRLLGVDRAR